MTFEKHSISIYITNKKCMNQFDKLDAGLDIYYSTSREEYEEEQEERYERELVRQEQDENDAHDNRK